MTISIDGPVRSSYPDSALHRIVTPTALEPAIKCWLLLRAALWASETGTIEAAAELNEDSPWLRYVPLEERRVFLQKVFLEHRMSGACVCLTCSGREKCTYQHK